MHNNNDTSERKRRTLRQTVRISVRRSVESVRQQVDDAKHINIPIMLWGVIALLLFFGVLTDWRNFSTPNLLLVARNSSILILASIGMTMVILVSQVDLSIGSVMSLSAAVAAIALQAGYGIAIALGVGLLSGVLVGLINGILVAVLRFDFWISTFATMGIGAGLALVILGGTMPMRDPFFRAIGTDKLFGIHYVVYLTALIVCFIWFLLRCTKFGYNIYSIGGSEQAAHLSGVNVTFNRVAVFACSGFFAAVAGLTQAAMTTSANPIVGATYSFDAMAAVIIGGTGFSGGKGGIWGTVFGAIALRVLAHGLAIMKVSSNWQKAIIGVVIVAVLVTDAVYTKMQNRKELRRVYSYE